MTKLLININRLLNVRDESTLLRGSELAILPQLEDAYILIEDGIIADYGNMFDLDTRVPNLPKEIIDLKGQFVLPAWCDSHTHIVFAKTREEEFVDKLKGATYAEIAARGGG